MRQLMEDVAKAAKRRGIQFCDVRICKNIGTAIRIQDGLARQLSSMNDYGAAVRVFKNGTWGFASTNSVDKKSMMRALDDALSSVVARKSKLSLPNVKPVIGVGLSTFTISPENVSEKEKLKVLSKLEGDARKYSKKVTNTELNYSDNITTEYVANSAGTYTEQTLVRTTAGIAVTASDGKKKQTMRKRVGALGGFEIIQNISSRDFGIAAAETAIGLLKAKDAPSGRMTVITDPDITGLFAHEACGHNSEGDLIAYKHSIFAGMKDEKIASDKVTLIDDPTIPNRHGSFFYDSEGVPARSKVLIDKGVLVGSMNSIETAGILGGESTGSGRAYLHQNIPIVRMSNTYFGPGNKTLDELISDVKFGILAKGFNWGYVLVDRGQFTCNVQEAWAIRNGKIAEPYGNLSIGGLTLDTLKNVDGCTTEYTNSTVGMCGKNGQWMWVGTGGPYMRIKNMQVGGYRQKVPGSTVILS